MQATKPVARGVARILSSRSLILVSIGFGLFPMHMYNVVRSGVDPLVAKITLVHPVSAGDPAADLVSSAADASRLTSRTARRPE